MLVGVATPGAVSMSVPVVYIAAVRVTAAMKILLFDIHSFFVLRQSSYGN